MPNPIQVTTGPLDDLRMVSPATPLGRPEATDSIAAHGTGESVPYALPHPPPVLGGLHSPEHTPLPEDAIFVEDANILQTNVGSYVTGLVAGSGRLFRYPTTLTTLSVGLTFFDENGLFIFVNSVHQPAE